MRLWCNALRIYYVSRQIRPFSQSIDALVVYLVLPGVVYILIRPDTAMAWAVSEHADTRRNTEATFNCCCALHTYDVGAVFSRDKLFA